MQIFRTLLAEYRGKSKKAYRQEAEETKVPYLSHVDSVVEIEGHFSNDGHVTLRPPRIDITVTNLSSYYMPNPQTMFLCKEDVPPIHFTPPAFAMGTGNFHSTKDVYIHIYLGHNDYKVYKVVYTLASQPKYTALRVERCTPEYI